jgi:hypothetical protein
MESIGLYHQTGNGTSRFLLVKSISRLDWREPAARHGMAVILLDRRTITQQGWKETHGRELSQLWCDSTTP